MILRTVISSDSLPLGGANVIICICEGINDREIKKLVEQGHNSTKKVMKRCRAGLDCGGCKPLVDELVSELNHKNPE